MPGCSTTEVDITEPTTEEPWKMPDFSKFAADSSFTDTASYTTNACVALDDGTGSGMSGTALGGNGITVAWGLIKIKSNDVVKQKIQALNSENDRQIFKKLQDHISSFEAITPNNAAKTEEGLYKAAKEAQIVKIATDFVLNGKKRK